jgi:hypothetical protein
MRAIFGRAVSSSTVASITIPLWSSSSVISVLFCGAVILHQNPISQARYKSYDNIQNPEKLTPKRIPKKRKESASKIFTVALQTKMKVQEF